MTVKTPRVRMFAGPNGSGKSTMIGGLDSRLSKLFLNADNLERDLKENPILDLTQFDTNGADLTFNPEFDGELPIWFETHVLVHLDNEAE